jgi:hypothetical protein
MERSVPRIGSWAGWLSVIGIMGYHVVLTIVAGQRVSGTDDVGAITAYYGQSIVAVLGVEQFLVVVPVLIFGLALRETLATTPGARLLASVALGALVIELPVVLTEISAQAALVAAVKAGEPVGGLFRFWDVLYNSGLYPLEATWVLAFGLAMREHAAFPRFMTWLTPLTALLLAINVTAIWVGIPDAATLPSAVLIAVWLAGASVGLGRVAGSRSVPEALPSRA